MPCVHGISQQCRTSLLQRPLLRPHNRLHPCILAVPQLGSDQSPTFSQLCALSSAWIWPDLVALLMNSEIMEVSPGNFAAQPPQWREEQFDSPRQLVCFMLIQPVNCETGEISFCLIEWAWSSARPYQVLVSALAGRHLCASSSSLLLALMAPACGNLLHVVHGAELSECVLDFTSWLSYDSIVVVLSLPYCAE